MGSYTLHQGDCLDVLRGVPTGSVDAVITDPPYGIDYQSAWRTDKAARHAKIANDGQPFIWWLHDAYRVTKDGGALLCFCRWDVQEAFRLAIEWAGYRIMSHLIWDRENHGMADVRTMFAPQHDVIWFATKGRMELKGKRPVTVIRSPRLGGEQLTHPNQKPTPLMRYLVRAVTEPGDTVLDCFAGSGATGVAALAEERRFIGIEVDAKYHALANCALELAMTRQTSFIVEATGK